MFSRPLLCQRKTKVVNYGANLAQTMQAKFDELHAAGVLVRPEDFDVVVE